MTVPPARIAFLLLGWICPARTRPLPHLKLWQSRSFLSAQNPWFLDRRICGLKPVAPRPWPMDMLTLNVPTCRLLRWRGQSMGCCT